MLQVKPELKGPRRLRDLPAWAAELPLAGREVLVLALGALSALAFAPLNLLPLMWVAFAGLLWALDGATTRLQAFRLGWWFGLGQFALGLIWIAEAFRFQDALPHSAGYLAVMLLAAFLALFTASSALLAQGLAPGGAWRVVALATAWTLGEWLRGHLFTGFPWNLVGSAWLAVLPVAQAAGLVGVYGLSFLMVFTGGALGLAIGSRGRPPMLALFALGLLVLLFIGGALRLHRAQPPAGPSLAIVQANIGQGQKWRDETGRRNLNLHLDMTYKAPGRDAPRLVIWPETAIPNLIEEETTTRYLIARHLGADGLVLTGGVKVERDENGYALSARNSLFVIDPNAQITASYDKSHLVPFGEYLPFRDVLTAIGLSRLAAGDLDFTPGPGPRTIKLSGFPSVGPLICYEIIFPGAVVDRNHRPEWLLNISNDAWFGTFFGPYQHLAQARLRAIEEGLPVVRSTPTGISSIIDARGQVLKKTGLEQKVILYGNLPTALPATPYARNGDLPVLAILILCSLSCIICAKRVGKRNVRE